MLTFSSFYDSFSESTFAGFAGQVTIVRDVLIPDSGLVLRLSDTLHPTDRQPPKRADRAAAVPRFSLAVDLLRGLVVKRAPVKFLVSNCHLIYVFDLFMLAGVLT